jgi:hypothetical protein
MRYAVLLTLIGLPGCCGGGNPDCIGVEMVGLIATAFRLR